jgi:hypothetical protein
MLDTTIRPYSSDFLSSTLLETRSGPGHGHGHAYSPRPHATTQLMVHTPWSSLRLATLIHTLILYCISGTSRKCHFTSLR